MEKVLSRDPTTGRVLKEYEATPVSDLPALFARAKTVQAAWAGLTLAKRARALVLLREAILNHVDELADLISSENGKPRFEALSTELFPCVELLTHFAKRAPRLLRDQPVPLRLMRHRRSRLNYWPLGTVLVISPWNFPFLLPFGQIAMALVSGNSVVFKPSEITPQIGLKIQELIEEAGLPANICQTVLGDGALGAALIDQKPDKIFFTGSVNTGKRIMAAAASHLIPVTLELGGKDAMIVLSDADLDLASSAALWGGFMNAGQACASVERLLVHQSVADPFTEMLREKMTKLRRRGEGGDAFELGPVTLPRQAEVYDRHLDEARKGGCKFIAGGDFSADHRFLSPTLVTGTEIEKLSVYQEETFGPVVALTTFRSVSEAIQKTNSSRYGLTASIFTRNHGLANDIAKQLEVGTVTVNEVTYTAGLPETPWGGVKESGFGRVHADVGLYEFVNTRHIHAPRSRLLTFKSLWWFPYTPFQYATFRTLFEMYRRHWSDKVRSFPHLLWNFAQFLKGEKRL